MTKEIRMNKPDVRDVNARTKHYEDQVRYRNRNYGGGCSAANSADCRRQALADKQAYQKHLCRWLLTPAMKAARNRELDFQEVCATSRQLGAIQRERGHMTEAPDLAFY